jgi:DNA polymerase-3 subunit gamma/tau
VGTGFTELDESPGAKTTSRRYINDKSETKSISGYNVISREETIAKIEELIEERTGISVRVVCTRIDEDEDFNRRYIALEELVGMDIEIDDKEEFI